MHVIFKAKQSSARWAAWALCSFALSGCEPTGARTASSSVSSNVEPGATRASRATPAPSEYRWQERISSPQPNGAPSGYEALSKQCVRFDAGLSRVALEAATREAQGEPPLADEELSFALRAAGVPQVWPRAWSISGRLLDKPDVVRRAGAWLASTPNVGELRCGLAEAQAAPDAASSAGGRHVVALVVVDAIADLSALPTSARAGEWLRVDARLLVPASGAKVVVLGPAGSPQTVPTTLRAGRIKAVVHADRPGFWLIQALPTLASGPRPALEALISVGVEPPASFTDQSVPGEAEGNGVSPTDVALERMINAARVAEGLPPLHRNAALDAVAQRHASAMQYSHQVAHDVGDGDPQQRATAAGIVSEMLGENVAYAKDVRTGHRVLWSSPSHRENLLQPRFDSIGVGVAVDDDGSVWLCELFANFGRAGN